MGTAPGRPAQRRRARALLRGPLGPGLSMSPDAALRGRRAPPAPPRRPLLISPLEAAEAEWRRACPARVAHSLPCRPRGPPAVQPVSERPSCLRPSHLPPWPGLMSFTVVPRWTPCPPSAPGPLAAVCGVRRGSPAGAQVRVSLRAEPARCAPGGHRVCVPAGSARHPHPPPSPARACCFRFFVCLFLLFYNGHSSCSAPSAARI